MDDFGAGGPFTISGQLETQTESGNYKFTAKVAAEMNIIPALNSVTETKRT